MMSRSGYSEDYGDDFPGQLGLYRANVKRSINSQKGQARLRELRGVLEAMPVKTLAAGVFRRGAEACALGEWALANIGSNAALAEAVDGYDGDDSETARLLASFGWPRLVVLDLVYENDRIETVREPDRLGPHQSPYAYHVSPWQGWPLMRWREETPGERHARVLAWVKRHIREVGDACA